jgi:hypothetical protein
MERVQMPKLTPNSHKTVRTFFRTPLAATAALVLLAAPSACAPQPRDCSPRTDRFDSNGGRPSENDRGVHPATAVAAVALAGAGALAGHRCS